MCYSDVGLFILYVSAWFESKKQKDQSMWHVTNHKGTRELDFTEILMWLLILDEFLESHDKIKNSVVIKKKVILAFIREDNFKKWLTVHIVYSEYPVCICTVYKY